MRSGSDLQHSIFHWKTNIFLGGRKSVLILILLPSSSQHCLKMLLGNGRAAENKWNKILSSMYFNLHQNFKEETVSSFVYLAFFSSFVYGYNEVLAAGWPPPEEHYVFVPASQLLQGLKTQHYGVFFSAV